ncbi:hypothetical protein LP419_39895 [Massilia sp. H-1]|nr:hypothetical protein LP419_39895 [Massilia sp. H-1]
MQGIYVSTSGRVKNNVVYRVAEGGIHLWHDARRDDHEQYGDRLEHRHHRRRRQFLPHPWAERPHGRVQQYRVRQPDGNFRTGQDGAQQQLPQQPRVQEQQLRLAPQEQPRAQRHGQRRARLCGRRAPASPPTCAWRRRHRPSGAPAR